MRGLRLSIDLNPSPHPSPYGRGSRPSQPRVSGSVRASEVGTCGAIHASPSSDRHGRPPRSPAERHAADRFQIPADRRPGRAGRLARAGAARVPVVAELPHPADRGGAGATHARQLSRGLSVARHRPPVPQFRSIRGRLGSVRAGGRHRAGLDERAHQHAVQDAVLRAHHHPAGDPGNPVHGVVDHAGEPQDRADQPRPAETHRHRHGLRRHLHHDGHDLGRRAALFAHGVPADERGVPLHGPFARGIRADERRLGAADRVADHLEAGLAGGARLAADPVRALDRIVRGAGAARACRSASTSIPRRSTRRSINIRARSGLPPPMR